MSAAGPCTTGEEHCEQATTNGHDAECNLLHDVPSCVHRRDRRLGGIMQPTGVANHCAPDQFADSVRATTLRGTSGRSGTVGRGRGRPTWRVQTESPTMMNCEAPRADPE